MSKNCFFDACCLFPYRSRMDIQTLLDSLHQEFPHRNIVCIPPEEPEEIIVELDRAPSRGTALALIRRSKLHMHYRTTETYIVENGTLILFVGGERRVLRPGDRFIITPNRLHHAVSEDGKFARVLITSEPPWSSEDHVLA
jgi:mannose-6-phosphate isomerase-like protein (cupin superfamily)